MSTTIELPYNEPLLFKPKNVFTYRITIQWTFSFKKKMSSTIELPCNEPLSFNQKNVFNHRFTIQWTFTFRTKKRLQPSNYHKRNLYLSNKNMSSNIELPYNEPLPFQQIMFQPSNYHTMNLYLSNEKTCSTIELPYNGPLPFKQKNVFNYRITIQWTFIFQTKKMSSTIELPYNEPLSFKQKNVFNHRITIQWTFTFQIKKRLQPSNYHTINLYLSNKKMSSTTELPYNELLPFKQKNVFHHQITIQWTFTFQIKKRLQPSNYHPMNLYISNKKTSSTIELPYNEPLTFKRKNIFNHRITIQWTFTFQTKKCLQQTNYYTMNLYLSNKKTTSNIELPYNEPLHFKRKNVFNHRITIQWTFTFQTKECLQPPNYHTMNLYISNKKRLQPSNYHTMYLSFQTKKCLQPSNYHTMNLYFQTKKCLQQTNYHTMNH